MLDLLLIEHIVRRPVYKYLADNINFISEQIIIYEGIASVVNSHIHRLLICILTHLSRIRADPG